MRGIATRGVFGVLLALTACSQAEAPEPRPAHTEVRPSEAMQQTFAGCDWGRVDGASLSVWSYACGPEQGEARLVADESLPGFAIESGGSRQPVIITFAKPSEAPIHIILEAVRARSPGAHTAGCILTPAPQFDRGAAGPVYTFAPTGEAKAGWDALASGAEDAAPMEPPCGELGEQMAGDRYFQVLAGDPSVVVWVNAGSEIQIFDPGSLSPRAAD
jgi:hypothetical protein